MHSYPHHIGDYGKDTRNLSVTEHGAYRLLLDYQYATEQPIPNDLKELYRIVGAQTAPERKSVDKVAERFFPVNGDGRRHNKRAEAEIARYTQRAEHNRAVGRLGGRPKKPGDNPEVTRKVTRTEPEGEPGDNPSQNHKPRESTSTSSDASHRKPATVSHGLPDCPHDKLQALYHEVLPALPRVVEWNAQRQALMRARWREQAIANGTRPGYAAEAAGLAFWRRFFQHVAKSNFLCGRANPTPGRKVFVADLEWLIRPTNFAKVVEGKYDN